MTITDIPAGLPPLQRRPSSMTSADLYGMHGTGVPSTVMQGTSGGGRVEAATTMVDAQAPITVNGIGPDFLARPAGVLAIMVVGLLVWSFVQR